MRRTLIALLALAGGIASALAGDFADREVIGFSPDGASFAFEEYGVQDGSGFPYSNIFIIDTATDQWLIDPVRLLDESETTPLQVVRSGARRQVQPTLEQYGIAVPGSHVAASTTEGTGEAPDRLEFQPRGTVPPSGPKMVLQIAEMPFPSDTCPAESGPYNGFQLTMTGSEGPRTLQSDTRIPGSRNCPKGYGLSDVVTYYPPGGDPVIAVFVSVYSLGFEGPNRRFIAVATPFKE